MAIKDLFGSAEENHNTMMNNNEYKRGVGKQLARSQSTGRALAKVAEGLANGSSVTEALAGNEHFARAYGDMGNGIVKSEKLMNKARKNKGQVSTKPKETKPTKPKVDYSNLNESYKDNNSTFDDLKKYYQDEKGLSDEEFAEVIKNSDWSKGSKANEWLNEFNTSSSDTKEDKTTYSDLAKKEKDMQDKELYKDSEVAETTSKPMKYTKEDQEELNEYAKILNEESSRVDDYYKDGLATSIFEMYKNGELDGNIDTGNKEKDDKTNKRIAKQRLGYYILNDLATNLVNGSLVARGSSPTQESDLQKMRRTKLEGALDRYNKKRDETMSNTLKQLGMNAELLTQYNVDVDKLRNNKIWEEFSNSRNRKNKERTLKALNLAGKYLTGLSPEEIENVFLSVLALNSNDAKSAGLGYLGVTVGPTVTKGIRSIFDLLGGNE